jgi:low temperature requirement protein LtrA
VSAQAQDVEERRTSSVELLWDLVFVFAVTEVTTLLARDLSWAGLGRAMLVLALMWWAWSAFVWAANAASATAVLHAVLLAAMVAIFIAGVAIPRVFGAEATLFAATYAAVRFLHLALYADASRRGDASWSAIAGFAVTVVAGMGLLLAGSFLARGWREAFWAAAVAIDYAGPGWLTRRRLRGLQHVAVAHFAERYGLFVIVCLGESIVALGVSAGNGSLSAPTVAAVSLGVTITAGLWWTYFGRFAALGEASLRAHDDPVLAASDAYSYLHLLLVAGIIVFAAGARLLAQHAAAVMPDASRLALCGGVAAYLLGLSASHRRLTGTWALARLAACSSLLVLFAFSGGLPAWAVACAVAGMLALLCVAEQLRRPRRPPTAAIPSAVLADEHPSAQRAPT